MWVLNRSGCHDSRSINQGEQYNEVEECAGVQVCFEDNPNKRHERYECNAVGGKVVVRSCNQIYQECHGDPDTNMGDCAAAFTKSQEEALCSEEYEEGCWSDALTDNLYGDYAPCCGDDAGDGECWVDVTDVNNPSACCLSNVLNKVVYLKEPDESQGYCNLLGQFKTGELSAGPCDEEGETYCWDPNYEEHGGCCGDDLEIDTWDEYSTSRYVGEVLVFEFCYNGKWVLVPQE